MLLAGEKAFYMHVIIFPNGIFRSAFLFGLKGWQLFNHCNGFCEIEF